MTAYAEWVLGPSRTASAPFVTTEIDPETGAMFARNPWNAAFGSRVAFADFCGRQTDWTGDRREFIGRNGTLASPAALAGAAPLSNNVGAGLDPCGALRTKVKLPPNGIVEVVFFLGQAASAEDARSLIAHYRTADLDAVRREVDRHWDDVLGAVQVKTPDRSMDIMLNGWLLYQTLACRIWARSAFYQASGAYGFRDQLQDGMALASTRPTLTREHLLRAAAGSSSRATSSIGGCPDSGQGVRTRISDDRAWLAYAAAHYIDATGDAAVLDEMDPIPGRPEAEGGRARQLLPADGFRRDRHPVRALRPRPRPVPRPRRPWPAADRHRRLERRHEPRRRTRPGRERLARLAPARDAHRIRSPCRCAWRDVPAPPLGARTPQRFKASLEREAWDGDWYRRGYFDDGTPLGSATSEECRIDSIAQSWAVISGAADIERAARAMAAVERELDPPQGSAWRCCLRRRSTRRRSIPAISRAIRRASARTAANIPMPRCGR